jgi:hypothetical protein
MVPGCKRERRTFVCSPSRGIGLDRHPVGPMRLDAVDRCVDQPVSGSPMTMTLPDAIKRPPRGDAAPSQRMSEYRWKRPLTLAGDWDQSCGSDEDPSGFVMRTAYSLARRVQRIRKLTKRSKRPPKGGRTASVRLNLACWNTPFGWLIVLKPSCPWYAPMPLGPMPPNGISSWA